jgi:tetratricopeptide (TPR) repeat protein
MGLVDEALAQFEQSHKIAPDFDRAVINTAIVYSNQGQRAKARQVLEEFLAGHGDDADARAALDKMGAP